MTGPTIAIVNESTVLTDDQVAAAVPAMQTQVSRDFAPTWGRDASLSFTAKNAVAADAWRLVVADTSDQAGALGYHDLTPSGLPQGFVFAADDVKYGLSWTVTLSHELLEMLGDPYINLTAEAQITQRKGRFFAYEACDPVEADILGYAINGVSVSDFVLPAWFLANAPAPYDFTKTLNKPFQVAAGGYVSYLDSTGRWKQVTKDMEDVSLLTVIEDHMGRHPAYQGTRRERRLRGFTNWQRSTR